ncbi:MAG: PQQ-binding-like beta-propeller repeat protein, partial [Elusimicrobia bacterium]|nr:PQQ-binding-like beta-propeller repeat protein [Elusimicrobiota bacterium]
AANTTHSFLARCKSCGTSADSALYALATLAKQPLALEKTFTAVSQSSATVAWAARLASPLSESAEGYRLEASSTAFAVGTLVVSSETPNVLLSTLTISGILPNTTYYFRVASINWASSLSPYTSLGSTSSLAVPPQALPGPFLEVFKSSVTAAWQALPASPPDASSKTAEGYILEASSTNFGALLPGGVVSSSGTNQVLQSTLTVISPALQDNTTYYFRVGSLNWNGSPNYLLLGSTRTRIAAFADATAASKAPARAPQGAKTALLRLDASPQASAVNGLRWSSLRVQWMDKDLTPLTNAQAQALFTTMFIAADALGNDTTGLYHSNVDTVVVASLASASFALDASGRQILTAASPAPPEAVIPAGQSRIFFLAVEWKSNAASQVPNTVRVQADPDLDLVLKDPPSGEPASVNPSAAATSSSATAIAAAPPVAGWPRDLGGAQASVQGGFAVNDDSDAAFAGTDDGRIAALNNDGTLKWSFNTSPLGAVKTFPTVVREGSQDFIYFANDQGDIYKIRDDGIFATQMWKRDLTGSFLSAPALPGSVIFIGAVDAKVYKLDYLTGDNAIGWGFDATITGAFSGTPYVDTYTSGVNALWIGSEGGTMYRLGTADGTVTTSSQTIGAAIRTTPNLDAGFIEESKNTHVLFWGADDGILRARTSANLTTIPTGWTDFAANPKTPIRSSPYLNRLESPKGLYFGADNGILYKLNAQTGALIWSFQTGAAIRAMPIVLLGAWTGAAQDYVYFGSDDGFVYALNAADGTARSNFPVALGGAVRSGPTYDSTTNAITVGSMDGRALRIGVGP